jgi:hypothetical protein
MREKTHRVTENWSPKKFIYEKTDERLIPNAGIEAVLWNFDQSILSKELLKTLPARQGNSSCGSKTYGYMFILGFLNGWDSIDDLEELQGDYWAKEFFEDKIPCPKACGNFLRSFEEEHLEKLNLFLRTQARSYRRNLTKVNDEEEELIIDIDSTDHEQSGKKMEGLAYNYKDHWCLDSLLAFDQKGFCHGMELRSGNTHTSVGSGKMIEHCFEGLDPKLKRYLRGDSGYCNEEVIRACLHHKAKFTIVAHDNMGWSSEALKITEWIPWEYSKEEKEKALKQAKVLPKVELGSFLYFPKWAEEKLAFPVVIKRMESIKDQGTLFESLEYKYYGVVTNFSLYDHSLQEVMEFYQKRANCENMIREEKHNYDMLHFPCQKLKANHAYGLFALIAHNMVRHIAFLVKPDKPMFAKKIRRGFFRIPAKVVEHSRQLYLKVSENFIKEVKLLEHLLSLAAYEASWNTS